ncbi:MAG: ATP-binding protein, partial [Chloroflexi bacterium]|nr:ATP-binding protein [Chloroflexota bacterium]
TFDSFDERGSGFEAEHFARLREANRLARAFAEAPGGWLILDGESARGKTHLAAAIANFRETRGADTFFVTAPDLLDHLRATYAPDSKVGYDELFETVRQAPLLILDDLGTQSATPWAQEKLFQLINHRYNLRLPTVITTNLRLEQIDERLRVRLSDPALCDLQVVREWENKALQRLSRQALEGLRQMTFDSFDERGGGFEAEHFAALREARRLARAFAEAPNGWLILHGESARGKTHLAAAIANFRESKGQDTFFVTAPDLLDHLRATYAPDSKVGYDEVFEAIRSTPLLVLDDLGAHSSTPWAEEKLYQLLNYRYNARLPTVITTDCLEEQEPRLYSRMVDPAVSRVCPLDVPPFRGSERPTTRRPRKR